MSIGFILPPVVSGSVLTVSLEVLRYSVSLSTFTRKRLPAFTATISPLATFALIKCTGRLKREAAVLIVSILGGFESCHFCVLSYCAPAAFIMAMELIFGGMKICFFAASVWADHSYKYFYRSDDGGYG